MQCLLSPAPAAIRHSEITPARVACRVSERSMHACGQVSQLANYLKSVGVGRGSDVTIYMPMIPELPAAMAGSFSPSCHAMHMDPMPARLILR